MTYASRREKVNQTYQATRAVEAAINNLDFSALEDGGARLIATLETALGKHRVAADKVAEETRIDGIIKGDR
ncbi:hypothetical protein HOU02_gp321 [Caulobacter phage CcrBL9]|uniref:Uncharacterized protein n=1 Tax=Caulobacter phage CcrBL9 TaxID=2283270 RepID=A0A385EBY8_9CAUD|nr:hypothetical protein HOU02_gp321 [Caulobacter phage CcrBL9]AXQ69404.1 hypothetical protein CcrBL9_gp380 [Caulobacter phage CcrBL9]